MRPEDAAEFLPREFEREERNGFARAGRIPDTHLWKFLAHYRRLTPQDAAVLKRALAKHRARQFLQDPNAPQLNEEEDAAFRNLQQGMALLSEWKWISIKLLKMHAGSCQSPHAWVRAQVRGFEMPPEILSWINSLTTCKAATMRKLVKVAFGSRFGLEPENEGGGVWVYRDPDRQMRFEVEIDYGGTWGQQLRYQVRLVRPADGKIRLAANYEILLGMGIGDWDFITEGNADQSIALLTDLVEDTVRIGTALLDD